MDLRYHNRNLFLPSTKALKHFQQYIQMLLSKFYKDFLQSYWNYAQIGCFQLNSEHDPEPKSTQTKSREELHAMPFWCCGNRALPELKIQGTHFLSLTPNQLLSQHLQKPEQ